MVDVREPRRLEDGSPWGVGQQGPQCFGRRDSEIPTPLRIYLAWKVIGESLLDSVFGEDGQTEFVAESSGQRCLASTWQTIDQHDKHTANAIEPVVPAAWPERRLPGVNSGQGLQTVVGSRR